MNLRAESWPAKIEPFGHPSQVRAQVLVLQACIDLRVRLARGLCIETELMTSFALTFNPYKQPIFTPSDFEDYSQIIIERSVGAKGSC